MQAADVDIDFSLLTDEERDKFGDVTLVILAALRSGPKHSVELSTLSPAFGKHVTRLRQKGYPIQCHAPDGPKRQRWIYRLLEGKPIPTWKVTVHVHLANGEECDQDVEVGALTERQAKAKARSVAALTAVQRVQMISLPVTGDEHDTYWEGH